MSAPALALVAAVAENGVIGRDGDMPWRLPTDLRHFRAITLGKPVIMGRRTLESIGKPLAGRDNLVLSRDPAYAPEGVQVFADLEAALAAADAIARARGVDEVVVAGGGVLYAALIDRADRLHLTRVAAAPEGDTRFPPFGPPDWVLVADEAMPRGDRDSADARWQSYVRARPTRVG